MTPVINGSSLLRCLYNTRKELFATRKVEQYLIVEDYLHGESADEGGFRQQDPEGGLLCLARGVAHGGDNSRVRVAQRYVRRHLHVRQLEGSAGLLRRRLCDRRSGGCALYNEIR